MFRTPLVLVTLRDKSVLEFFTEREFKAWAASEGSQLKGWSSKYFKGLGTWTTAQFSKYIENMDQYMFSIKTDNPEDVDAIDMAFNGERAGDRKVWLETSAGNFEDFIEAAK